MPLYRQIEIIATPCTPSERLGLAGTDGGDSTLRAASPAVFPFFSTFAIIPLPLVNLQAVQERNTGLRQGVRVP